MKRFFPILLCFLLTPSLLFAENLQLARMNPYIAGSGSVGATYGKIGWDTQFGTDGTLSGDVVHVYLATASSTGSLHTGYIYTGGEYSGSVKICVYNKASSAPGNAGDTLIGCSGSITESGSGGWLNDGGNASGSVTASTDYWVAVMSNAVVDIKRNGTATVWYKGASGCYAAPSTCLTSGGFDYGDSYGAESFYLGE